MSTMNGLEQKAIGMPEVTASVTKESATKASNRSIDLRAAQDKFYRMGAFVDPIETQGIEKGKLMTNVKVGREEGTDFPMTDDDVHKVVSLLPLSWIDNLRLSNVLVLKPARIVLQEVQAGTAPLTYIPVGYESDRKYLDVHTGEEKQVTMFVGSRGQEVADKRMYEHDRLQVPESDEQFMTTQIQLVGGTNILTVFDLPESVKQGSSPEAVKELMRREMVKELIRGSLDIAARTGATFEFDGKSMNYEQVLQEYVKAIQEEPESVTRQSEVYKPLLRTNKAHVAVENDLYDILTDTLLGWSLKPQGDNAAEPVNIEDRDFGGTAKATGKSKKLAFAEALLKAQINQKEQPQQQAPTLQTQPLQQAA